jgi:hypothetical protein
MLTGFEMLAVAPPGSVTVRTIVWFDLLVSGL